MGTIEVRCPSGPRRLFTKLRLSGESPRYVDGNLIEFACPECRRLYRQRGVTVDRVLHQYNFLGELVSTVTEPKS